MGPFCCVVAACWGSRIRAVLRNRMVSCRYLLAGLISRLGAALNLAKDYTHALDGKAFHPKAYARGTMGPVDEHGVTAMDGVSSVTLQLAG